MFPAATATADVSEATEGVGAVVGARKEDEDNVHVTDGKRIGVRHDHRLMAS